MCFYLGCRWAVEVSLVPCAGILKIADSDRGVDAVSVQYLSDSDVATGQLEAVKQGGDTRRL